VSIDVSTEIEIRRPRSEVSAFASDPDNVAAWYANIKEVDWKTPKPLAVGTQIAFVARFLRSRLEYVYEIKDFVPGWRLVMATNDGPIAMETTYTWEDAGEGSTKMTLRNRGEPPRFSGFFAPLVASAVRRANRKDLANLKKLLES
jgi:hypothetical protein